jgi:hypothetical protein
MNERSENPVKGIQSNPDAEKQGKFGFKSCYFLINSSFDSTVCFRCEHIFENGGCFY